MANIWTGVIKVIGSNKGPAVYFTFSMLSHVFFPLQGFIVFIRSRYMDLRRKNPDLSSWKLLAEIFDDKRLPRGGSSNLTAGPGRETGLSGRHHLVGFITGTTSAMRLVSSQLTNSAEKTTEFWVGDIESPKVIKSASLAIMNTKADLATAETGRPVARTTQCNTSVAKVNAEWCVVESHTASSTRSGSTPSQCTKADAKSSVTTGGVKSRRESGMLYD